MSAATTPETELVELETPLGREWEPVVRLVLGGVADRLGLGFEELDDLQLAVERLLAEAGTVGTVRLSFEVGGNGIRTRVGPLSEDKVAEALRDGEAMPGELTLRRILQTVVDSFGVDQAGDGRIVVRLEKVKGLA